VNRLSDFDCPDCGREYKSRSGLWKHKQKCLVTAPPTEEHEEVTDPPRKPVDEVTGSNDPDLPLPSENDSMTIDSKDDWIDFDFGIPEGDELVTEAIPSVLKAIRPSDGKRQRKLTAKEQKARNATNRSLLVMALGGVDYGITQYGRAITLDPEYECTHSESDKQLVAGAQTAWLNEKGIDLSNTIGTGMVAAALTGYYIIPPVVKVSKNAKKPFIPRGSGRLRKWFSKFRFGRRRKEVETPQQPFMYPPPEGERNG